MKTLTESLLIIGISVTIMFLYACICFIFSLNTETFMAGVGYGSTILMSFKLSHILLKIDENNKST